MDHTFREPYSNHVQRTYINNYQKSKLKHKRYEKNLKIQIITKITYFFKGENNWASTVLFFKNWMIAIETLVRRRTLLVTFLSSEFQHDVYGKVIVERNCCLYDTVNCIDVCSDPPMEYSPARAQDAKRVFYGSSGSGKSVIKYSLIVA